MDSYDWFFFSTEFMCPDAWARICIEGYGFVYPIVLIIRIRVPLFEYIYFCFLSPNRQPIEIAVLSNLYLFARASVLARKFNGGCATWPIVYTR